jgi:GAF domain-containing protein
MNKPFTIPEAIAGRGDSTAAFDHRNWRSQFVLTIARVASALGIILILLSYPASTPGARLLFGLLYGLLLAVTLLPVSYSIRAFSLLVISYAIGVNALIESGPYIDGSLFLFSAVILAGIFFDSKIDVLVLIAGSLTIASVAILNLAGILMPPSPMEHVPSLTGWSIYWADFSIIGIASVIALELFKSGFSRLVEYMNNAYLTMVSKSEQLQEQIQREAERLENRTSQFKFTNMVTRSVAGIENIPDLLDTTVNSIAEHFGYYHTGLYLLDDRRKNAYLQAASSIAGRQLLGQVISMDGDKENPVHLAVSTGKPHLDTSPMGGAFYRDPNFPLTRSRLLVPIMVRGDVIGILDMHSDKAQAFGSEDAESIQTLADLLALSLYNVRLSDEKQSLMKQLESFTSTTTSETWTKFTSRRFSAYQYTPAGVRPLFSPASLDDTGEGLQIPLLLKGQNIGNIKLVRKGSETGWSAKEKELVAKISDQVALALENSRLVEEAQKSSQRDQLIANISSRVRETLDVDSVIRTAAMEFRKVFDLKEAEISIGLPQAEPMRSRRTTSSLRPR